MAYAGVDDLQARAEHKILRQLASDDGETLDDARIQQALDDAASVIDGYLAPLPREHRPHGDVLIPYACDIAMYRLSLRRPGQTFQAIKAARDDAIRYLERVAQGKFAGGGSAAGASGGASASLDGDILVSGPEPVMTRETLKDL